MRIKFNLFGGKSLSVRGGAVHAGGFCIYFLSLLSSFNISDLSDATVAIPVSTSPSSVGGGGAVVGGATGVSVGGGATGVSVGGAVVGPVGGPAGGD